MSVIVVRLVSLHWHPATFGAGDGAKRANQGNRSNTRNHRLPADHNSITDGHAEPQEPSKVPAGLPAMQASPRKGKQTLCQALLTSVRRSLSRMRQLSPPRHWLRIPCRPVLTASLASGTGHPPKQPCRLSRRAARSPALDLFPPRHAALPLLRHRVLPLRRLRRQRRRHCTLARPRPPRRLFCTPLSLAIPCPLETCIPYNPVSLQACILTNLHPYNPVSLQSCIPHNSL